MLLTNRLRDPYDGLSFQAGVIRQNLSEMIVLRGTELVLDDDDPICTEIARQQVAAKVSAGASWSDLDPC